MAMHLRTNNSTKAAKRFTVKKLLRSALAMSFVTGIAGSVTAQSGLTLPSFPEDSAVLTLPVSQDASLPVAFDESIQPLPTPSYTSTSKRVTTLLGLKKLTLASQQSQTIPLLSVPPFPSTEPMQVTLEGASELGETTAHEPAIFRSTSGKKIQVAETENQSDDVVQASADESLSQVTIPPSLVQTELESEESIESESLDIPLGEVLGESLINVEIPKSLVEPVEEVQQRLPELLKRSPAMQLHIGGGPATSVDVEQSQSDSANFSLSDSGENESATKVMKSSGAKVMNVRIEGEPVVAQAPIISPQPKLTQPPVVAEAQVVAQAPIAAQVPARQTPTTESATATQKNTLFDPSAQNVGHKSLSDKVADRPPTIGERLEVGLHEAVNVDTPQPISGLSVEHPEYCQVLKSSDRSLSFVGLKAGQTRVALFTTSASGERKIEIREVVIAGAETRQADMKSLATEISRSVHRMYPNSRIEVIAEDEGLTVQGYAGSEEEAKKIIGLVRRTSLQPVVDRLATYK